VVPVAVATGVLVLFGVGEGFERIGEELLLCSKVCFHNHAADAFVRSSSDTAAFSLYMPTAHRPSSGEIVHMCIQDGFPFGLSVTLVSEEFIIRGAELGADVFSRD